MHGKTTNRLKTAQAAILLLAIAAAAAIATPTAQALADPPQTDAREEILQQATRQPWTTASAQNSLPSCGGENVDTPLTGGTTYLLLIYFSDGNGVGETDCELSVTTGGFSGTEVCTARHVTYATTGACEFVFAENRTGHGGDEELRFSAYAFTPTATATYYFETEVRSGGTCTGSCFTLNTLTFASPTASGSLGYQDESSGDRHAIMIFQDVERAPEEAILASELDLDPSSTQVTWTRLNTARDMIVSTAGGSSGSNVATTEFYQTLTYSNTHGRYLEAVRFHPTGSGTCSGQLSVSVVNQIVHPYALTRETGNLTATFTQDGSGGPDIIFNFVDGTITDDLSTVTFGTPTWSSGGTTRAWSSAPRIDDGYAVRIKFWSYSCTAGGPITMGRSTGSVYAGGSLFERALGSASFTDTSTDLLRIQLSAYGGIENTYYVNADGRQIAGAYHAFIRERQNDADPWRSASDPTSWTITSSETGLGIQIGEQRTRIVTGTGTPGQRESETLVRLMYPEPDPYAVTTAENWTVTVDMTESGGNVLHYASALLNQPAQPHVTRSVALTRHLGSGSLSTVMLFSTNDHNATLRVIVRECRNVDCTTFSDRVGHVTYEARVNVDATTGEAARTTTGAASTNAEFNVTGQDLPGVTIRVVLSRTGYYETGWDVPMPASNGITTVTLGIYVAEAVDAGQPSLVTSIVRIEGNSTRVVPDQISLNATRNAPRTLYLAAARVDTGGTLRLVSSSLATWTTTMPATIEHRHPALRASTEGDAGSFVLMVTNATGYVFAQQSYCIVFDTWNDRTSCVTPTAAQVQAMSTSVAAALAARTTIERAQTEAEAEEALVSHAINALDWFLGDPLGVGIPMMLLLDCLAIFVLGAGALRRRG